MRSFRRATTIGQSDRTAFASVGRRALTLRADVKSGCGGSTHRSTSGVGRIGYNGRDRRDSDRRRHWGHAQVPHRVFWVRHRPQTRLAIGAGAKVDPAKRLFVDEHQETSVCGLFAAGDLVRGLNQIAVADGEAAIAAAAIHNRLARTMA